MVVSLSVLEHEVSGSHLRSINWLEGESVLNEAITLGDLVVARLWVDVGFSELLTELAVPGLTPNELLVD